MNNKRAQALDQWVVHIIPELNELNFRLVEYTDTKGEDNIINLKEG